MKNKFQNVNFASLEDCYAYVQPGELEIMNLFRQVILETIPHCTEKLSYNVPYFYGNSRICYLWPASVPWGNVAMNGVQFGFCDGNQLVDKFSYLDKGNRKQVYYKQYSSVENVSPDDITIIHELLLQAVTIDNLKTKSRITKN
ncbi:MAG: DUF1801 domain-containing protein [Ignavibacteria bacterium]|nr:DUF1801 domain-containing protein [Ignavibacteria bacterium]